MSFSISSQQWKDIARSCEMTVFSLFIAVSVNTFATAGLSGLARYYVETLRRLPFVNSIVSAVVASEVKGALTLLTGADRCDQSTGTKLVSIPVSFMFF